MIIIDCDKCYKEDKQDDAIKRTAGGWGLLRKVLQREWSGKARLRRWFLNRHSKDDKEPELCTERGKKHFRMWEQESTEPCTSYPPLVYSIMTEHWGAGGMVSREAGVVLP